MRQNILSLSTDNSIVEQSKVQSQTSLTFCFPTRTNLCYSAVRKDDDKQITFV